MYFDEKTSHMYYLCVYVCSTLLLTKQWTVDEEVTRRLIHLNIPNNNNYAKSFYGYSYDYIAVTKLFCGLGNFKISFFFVA